MDRPSIPVAQKRRGRPPGEKFAPAVPIRLTAEAIAAVDAWRENQPGVPTRSEAIRSLLDLALRVTASDEAHLHATLSEPGSR